MLSKLGIYTLLEGQLPASSKKICSNLPRSLHNQILTCPQKKYKNKKRLYFATCTWLKIG